MLTREGGKQVLFSATEDSTEMTLDDHVRDGQDS